MPDWDIPAIAQALGGQLERAGMSYTIRLANRGLGVRLKLELDPENHRVRLWTDRDRKMRPTFLGRCDLHGVMAVAIAPTSVTFVTAGHQPAEMTVTKEATVLLSVALG